VPAREGEEVPTNKQRREAQREIQRGGTPSGNRWGQAGSRRTATYNIPATLDTTQMQIRAGDLMVDDRYNRSIDQNWVNDIANRFNPHQLQVLNVSRRLFRMVQRSRGAVVEEQVYDRNLAATNRVELVVISGQHRLLATMKAKGPDFLLNCSVYDGLTPEIEAELFALFDERVRPHQPWQRFRAHLFAHSEPEVSIDRIVRETGLVVYKGSQMPQTDGVIFAVSTLVQIYTKNGPEFLRRLLETHYMAWQVIPEGYTAAVMQGTAYMLRRFGGYSRWRDEWLGQALADPAHNAKSLLQRAQGAASGISATSVAQEVARLEHRWYQEGKRGYDRLPEWNATDREIAAQSENADQSVRQPRRKDESA
jgi:hypothetical protein